MREVRKKQLEKKGWKVGDASDFLGLSPEEAAYVEMRLRLADGLRARRVRRHLTQADVARTVRSSQSRIAKMEVGDSTVSLDLLIRALLALGATQGDVAGMIRGTKPRAA
jgi:DNA-binding XRE family transcriptional regulator